MRKPSVGQLKRTSEVLGNIAVAWFSAGVISPLFARPKNIIQFIFTFGISLVMAGIFFVLALELVKGVKS